MIKIAHVQLLPLLSGVQRVCLDELIRLDDNKFDKYLICRQEGPLTVEARKYGITCLVVPELVREISIVNDIKALYALWKIIKKHRFDIIHTHSSKTGVLGRIAAWLNRTKLIVHTVHGFSFPVARNKMQYLLFWLMEKIGSACGDITICLHEDDMRISTQVVRINRKKILIIGNGVDTERFKPYSLQHRQQLRTQLGDIKDNEVIVGMIGRLWPQKNPMYLLNALAKLIKDYPYVKCYFIGDGELREEMTEFISKNQLENNVKLFGWRNDTEVFLNIFDVFVLPSLWEGMPLAILEAKSCGLPCLVSNISGNRNIIDDGKDSLLFDLEQNGNDLHKKLQFLIEESDERKSLGQQARLNILQEYNIDVRIRRIEQMYLEHF
ncbi:glycosyltransferase family 4 protein [Xenorhabdus sp. TH1]|uniref:glycosyltransferase family 4 protein n=1 Tax=Xenorhabdus sp. TH1 TaxID=3130166 RepID=UPI0030D4E71E